MIEIKFPADRPDIARALGSALLNIAGPVTEGGGYEAPKPAPAPVVTEPEEAAPTTSETIAPNATEQEPPSDPKPTSLFESMDGESGPELTATIETATAGDVGGVAQTAGTDSPDLSASGARVDENGVAFNAAYCGEAAEPFYTTGKMRGQWKKKRGVEQDDYDAWYAAEQQKGGPTVEPEQPAVNAGSAFGAPVNSAAAFGGQQQAPVSEPEDDTPADAGSLMVWVSEKQAAGLITQEDVNSAWGAAGVASPADLFGPNAAEAVAAVFQHLKAKV